jgi:glyoxylase-like metal-dependent hydrolase (beta-lactamase superfamily II)
MDCGAARTVAPGLIVEGGGQSVFARQPRSADELTMAWRARLLCPTASVRTGSHIDVPDGVFPEEMTKGIYRLGYNAKSAYGAHSFAIRREVGGKPGNVMVDGPRFTRAVVTQFEAWGGLTDILLTHRDDVGDAKRYAEHFGARVWIHQADRDAAPYAGNILGGRDAVAIDADLTAVPVPGHTEGSVVFHYDRRCLFAGLELRG